MKSKRIIRTALSALIAGSMCLTVLPAQAANDHPNLLIGDADRDGVIDIDDVTAIQRRLAEMITFDEQTETMAKTDFSSDRLSINDASIIQMHLAEYDTPEAREVGHAAYVYKNKKYTEATSEYTRYVTTKMKDAAFSGVGFVTRNGHVLAQNTCGMANIADNKPVTMDTQFAVGSVSKQFCATAILMLQDQGKLSVNDKLEQYFPEYTIGKDLTLHQLLCMRSGIRDYINFDTSSVYQGHSIPFLEYELTGEQAADCQIILSWLFTQPLRYASAGSYPYSYSNSNFLLLALVVEQVSGMSYHDFVTENIFVPLGMTHSSFLGECQDSPDLAEHYFNHDNPVLRDSLKKLTEQGVDSEAYFKQITLAQSCVLGCGDLVSTAADMDKWLTALSDGTLLSAKSYRAMTTAYADQYGYGILIDNNESIKNSLFHNGKIYTYQASVYTLPSEHINVFVVTNDENGLIEQNKSITDVSSDILKKIVITEKNNE